MELASAVIDEILYLIPDSAKLTISPINANDLTHILTPKVETVFIAGSHSADGLTQEGKVTLDKLIAACKLPADSFVVLHSHLTPDLRWPMLTASSAVKRIISLGPTPDTLGLHIDFQFYKILNFNNIELIISHNIEDITPEHKKVLWGRLQTLFGIK